MQHFTACVSDSEVDDSYRQSFSRLISFDPALVRTVKNKADAVAAISDAAARDIRVNFRGSGHSFGDHCLSNGGMLLLNKICDPIAQIDEHRYQVSGGSSWLDTERALNAVGRSVPVLSNWLHVTVAGTLSAGGYGWSSLRHGAQTDNVDRVTLVDATGALRTLDAASGEQWDVATCAAGRLGFLTDCVLSTVASHRNVHISCRTHDTLDALLSGFRTDAMRADAPEMAWGQLKRGSFLQFAGARDDDDTPRALLAGGEVRHRAIAWDAWLATHSDRTFPDDVAYIWSDYVVTEAAFESFARLAWRLASESPCATTWRPRMRLLAMDCRGKAPPRQLLSASRLGTPGVRFGVGVYLEPPLARPDHLEAARSVQGELLSACIANGGRPYQGSWHDLSEAQAIEIYGADLSDARRLLGRHPGGHLINPGAMPPL